VNGTACGLRLALLLALSAGREPLSASPENRRAGPDWWSLQAVARPEVPTPRRPGWVRTPIDAFILAKLEAEGLEPAPPADRETFLRRATLDLLGLPPGPEEVEAFLADDSPAAFESLIDRLLASPRHGERWGRHWLDVARFAESHGFEYDKPRENAWRYRDYVVESFNADLPYDLFVKEQIAGDVLEPGPGESPRNAVAATGFLVAGPWDEAGNLQKSAVMRSRAREEELEDILGAVGQTFLGMTLNCARCHDHKFDPIPQRDYYRIKAVFDGVRHGERSLLSAPEAKEREARQESLEKRVRELEEALAAVDQAGRERILSRRRRAVASIPAPLARWNFDGDARDSIGGLHGTLAGGAAVASGRLRLNGKSSFVRTEPLKVEVGEKTLEAVVSLSSLSQRGGGVISLEARNGVIFDAIVFGERQPKKWLAGSELYHRSRDLDGPDEGCGPGELIHMAIVYRADGSIAVYRNGEPYAASYQASSSAIDAQPQRYLPEEARILLGLRHTGAGNGFLEGEIDVASLYDKALSAAEVKASFLESSAGVRREEILQALTGEERGQRERLRSELEKEQVELRSLPPVPMAYAASTAEPEPTFVLLRGDVEKKGEPVAPGGLAALKPLSSELGLAPDAPEGIRRRRFAEWVASAANPLTARVIVNRLWHHHFGRGIVSSPNDFGFNGDRPSHPELLDWLASELIAGEWSLKRLHRLIMLSSAYLQSSRWDEKAALVDAENRLLWRFSPRRLEAEAVRDAILSSAGRINLEMGGPSFKPFNISINNSYFYSLTDEDRPQFCRRSVYRMNINSAKDPLLDALDCPDPSVKTPRRSVTTTPLQALELMNSSFVLREARHLRSRIEREAGEGSRAQVERAYSLVLGRKPSRAETERAALLLEEHGLESLAWALFNSSEFLYVR
jgi:hypothetical protein